jgi:hypothetical protein
VALWVLLAASASRVVRLWSLGMARSTTTLGQCSRFTGKKWYIPLFD